ncbi:alpha/beta hydrolase [Corynebacterium lowii]|uniref:Alpha/beta hydrolase family protein n=1 Tax=Corynebacterium lowii TaxID=1544413 RepID=A0A0Q1E165_9CORY|nr:alpha/beta hydrolase [Corynebacterium lowii]KQB86205.1 Alpha/beta hydrolase family protein [Corynebacterium lowii]MDP9852679.1 fermentation-respiration switch protein FrsA (DUF1100 family) [Corynebacterium lowii]
MKEEVSFPSAGITLSGILFKPESGVNEKFPAIVIGHPFGSVKEQSPSNYAEQLVKRGFVCLVFDAAYQGESEGEPRLLENPWQRSEDVKAAVTYLSTRADVDSGKIGALGICASGGYVPFAAQTDLRIKAVATVSAADIGRLYREGMGGGQDPAILAGMLARAGELRTAEGRGEEPHLEHGVPNTADEAKAFPEGSMYNEAYDYYRTPRGEHPNSPNWWIFRSVDMIAQFDAYTLINMIAPRPLLMIAGSKADTRYFSEEAIASFRGPAELEILEGATHIDLYDKPEYVVPASEKIADFFQCSFGAE